jgi:hypothetical protein
VFKGELKAVSVPFLLIFDTLGSFSLKEKDRRDEPSVSNINGTHTID